MEGYVYVRVTSTALPSRVTHHQCVLVKIKHYANKCKLSTQIFILNKESLMLM